MTLARFWTQPSRDYRNFHLVYGLLGIHFVIPALGYLFAPDQAVRSFDLLGRLLGGRPYLVPEQSYIWRVLGATNVLTLGFLCFWVQLDVRRHWCCVAPLVFMKGTTALSYLGVFLMSYANPAFLAVSVWDGINCWAFVHFGLRAKAAAEAGEDELVPRPAARRIAAQAT